MNGIELRILGLFEAWDGLSATFTGIERLKNPVVQTPLRAAPEARGMVVAVYQGNRLGIYIG